MKKLSSKKLSTIWEQDQKGEYISLSDSHAYYRAFYINGGSKKPEIKAINGDLFAGIRAWMQENEFFPNIWYINDHGNATLYDNQGNSLGGIV